MKKKLFFLKFLFIFIPLFIFSCKEDSSIILTPDGGETYNFEIFKLKSENSYSYQEEDFNAGESSRLYLGSNDYNQNLYIYIKIKEELLINNPLCEADQLLNINSIDLKLPAISDFSDLNENLIDSSYINFFNDEANPEFYINAYKLNNTINVEQDNSSTFHQEDFLDLNNLSQNIKLPINISNIFDYISIDLRGYLLSEYVLNESQIDCSLLNYDDCLCNQINQNGDCIDFNNDCYWNNPNNDENGIFCFNNQSSELEIMLDDYCSGVGNDIDIVLEFSNSNLTTKIIELYSSDNSNIYNSPYLYVKYDVNGTSQEYINRYSISSVQSNYFNSETDFFTNINNESDLYGTVLGLDPSIISLINLDNENNLDCNINDCLDIESNTIIENEFNDVLFEYEVDLNEEILDSFEEINFYFNNVSFVFQDLDPSLDNWNDCGTDGDCMILDEDGTQNNLVFDLGENIEGNSNWDFQDLNSNEEFDLLYDSYELFDDYGLDSCLDENESGNNTCDSENSLYNNLGTENNNLWDQSTDGYDGDGNCSKDECEQFDDLGFDLVDDLYESGCFNSENIYGSILDYLLLNTYLDIYNEFISNSPDAELDTYTNDLNQTICGELHWIENCTTCSADDPNGDNYMIDPNQDDYDLDNNSEGTENNLSWDYQEVNNNNEFDIDVDEFELFFDYGIDGIPDLYENYNSEVEDDNYDINENPEGTENNQRWDYIDINGNNEFDIEYDIYEPFFDYGIDQLLSYQEDGYNLNGKQNNLIYDYYNNDIRENFYDYGLDQCQDGYEIGDNECCEDSNCNNNDSDLNVDNYIIDPNNDNYDVDENPEGTENNQILDWEDSDEDGLWTDYDEGEKWYDYGYDHRQNNEESNYLSNSADLTLGSNLYSLSIDNQDYVAESNNIIEFSQPSLSSDDQLALWISSIERIGENKYKIKVNVYSLLEIKAFQFQLKHIPFSSEIEIVDNQSLYLFSYEFDDDNGNYFPESNEIVENGLKYIIDATIYDLPEICVNSGCEDNNIYESNLFNLCYGYGIKNSLDFFNTNYSLNDFIDNHSNSNISNEFTNLVLYFDKTENSHHFIDSESEILFEYFHQDDSSYKIFEYINNQNVTESMDSIKINIGSLIQKYINNDYDYDGIKMTLSDENYNFNNLSIIYDENDNKYNPRLEIFYSE